MLPPEPFFIPLCDPMWAYQEWCNYHQIKHFFASVTEFADKYCNPSDMVIKGPGILIRITGIVPGWKATFHGIITGPSVYGYIKQLGQLADFVVYHFDLVRFDAWVPSHYRGVNRILQKVGFSKEATLQDAGRKDNIIHNMNIWRW